MTAEAEYAAVPITVTVNGVKHDAVVEPDPITNPRETLGQDHLAGHPERAGTAGVLPTGPQRLESALDPP